MVEAVPTLSVVKILWRLVVAVAVLSEAEVILSLTALSSFKLLLMLMLLENLTISSGRSLSFNNLACNSGYGSAKGKIISLVLTSCCQWRT